VGTAIGGFVWGGLVRTVFVHHGTFLINSAAHVWGKQPYATTNSSKDSSWLAFFTFGEGYHNFHHTYPADYRNGHRWWQWDPSKWLIQAASLVRLSDNLKRAPKWSIETARMETSFQRAASDAATEHGEEQMNVFQARSKACCDGLRSALRQIDAKRQQLKQVGRDKRDQLVNQLKQAKMSVKQVRGDFQLLLAEMSLTPRPSHS